MPNLTTESASLSAICWIPKRLEVIAEDERIAALMRFNSRYDGMRNVVRLAARPSIRTTILRLAGLSPGEIENFFAAYC
jgi:hypothetical protein